MTPRDTGTLYLVGTPIGNREDLAPRARRVLGEVDSIACEDTRTCRKLLAWLGLAAPDLVTYHDHNAAAAVPAIVERLAAGQDVAVVAEAGMPAIQDPGYRVVVAARERGFAVVPVPGPSAVVVALAASGLPTDRFTFLGYAPRRGRPAWWRRALDRTETVVVFEAPGRVADTLATIAALAPDRPVCLARELTKLHEEFASGPAAELAARVADREPLRGECALVVGGGDEAAPWPEALEAVRATRAGQGLSARDLVEILAAVYPDARNAIYRAVHGRAEDPPR